MRGAVAGFDRLSPSARRKALTLSLSKGDGTSAGEAGSV